MCVVHVCAGVLASPLAGPPCLWCSPGRLLPRAPRLQPPKDALDTMVLGAVDLPGLDVYTLIEHQPFDPTIKRTEGVSCLGGWLVQPQRSLQ